MKSDFASAVRNIVRHIPSGSVLSYGEVARRAGRPGAARAVGSIMSKNDDASVPCHRVIRADGSLGGYNGLRGKKAILLRNEGYIK